MALKTRRKASGRSQATVKAAMAPVLPPPMARSLGSVESLICASLGSGVPLYCRHHFLDQETGQPVTAAVEFKTAIEARIIRWAGRSHDSRRNTDGDGDRHRMLGDEVVEDGCGVEAETIQTDINTRRLIPLVFCRHIHRDGPRGTGKIFDSVSSNLKVVPAATPAIGFASVGSG